MTSKTIVLTGEEIRADYSGGTNAWLRNDGTATVYASTAPAVTPGADGTVSIPAGQAAAIYGACGAVYLLGTGSVQLVGSDYTACPFKVSTSTGGESGVDEVARGAIAAHEGNADIHISAAEKATWNGKAELSDIPTSLPADGGNADISKYIGTWGAPEQYYGNRLKARILFNKFGDSRLGLTTDTDNEIRVDYATNADTVGGKHADDFFNNISGIVSPESCGKNTLQEYIASISSATSSFYAEHFTDLPSADWGYNMTVNKTGGAYYAIAYKSLSDKEIYVRACGTDGTWNGEWARICDGGNADTLDGLHANEIASNPNLLLNPDFRVNQRGQAEYTSGYTVDRWYSPGKCSAAPISGGVKLTSTVTASSTTHAFWQDFEFPLPPGKYTLSLKAADVTGVWAARIRTVTAAGDYVDSYYTPRLQAGINSVTVDLPDSEYISAVSVSLNKGIEIGDSLTIEWMKLENGSATLFVHPDLATELEKCQRFYQIRSTNDIDPLDLRPSMRTITDIKAVEGGYAYVAEL